MTEQTIAGAHQRMDGHEELCAERQTHILAAIRELKDDMKWMLRGTLAVLLMVMGWGAIQLWNVATVQAQAHPVMESRR